MLIANRLFSLFPASTRETLIAEGRRVDLPIRAELSSSGIPVRHVYFLYSGAASAVVDMCDGKSAEVSMIGNEGLVGGAALLGAARLQTRCFMQIAGIGLRVPLTTMERCLEEVPESRYLVSEFLQSQMIIAAQSSACNRLHEADARLARWLLMSSDRAQSDVLKITQESVAQILGTQRSTIVLAAGILQRSGYIQYSRGRLRIADRTGLTTQACECYVVTKQVIENLYSHRKQTLPAAA